MKQFKEFRMWNRKAFSLAPMVFALALMAVLSGIVSSPAQAAPVIDLNGPGTNNPGVNYTAPNWVNGTTYEFGAVIIADPNAFVTPTAGASITQIEVKLGDGITTTAADSPDGTREEIFAGLSSHGNVSVTQVNEHTILITGTVSATTQSFNEILRSLQYKNRSILAGSPQIPGTPGAVTAGPRTINFTVTEDNAGTTATATAQTTLTVQYNDPPVVTVNSEITYTEPGGINPPAQPEGQIASNVTITEPNGQLITSMRMTLDGRVDHGKRKDADQTVNAIERLYFHTRGDHRGGVSGGDSGTITISALSTGETSQSFSFSYNQSTGVMNVTGNALAKYWRVVASYLHYQNTSLDPTKTDRTVTFQAFDAEKGSDLAETTIKIQKKNNTPGVSGHSSSTLLDGNLQATFHYQISDVDDQTWNGEEITDRVKDYNRAPASEKIGELDKYFRVILGATHGTLALNNPKANAFDPGPVSLLHFTHGSDKSANMTFYGRQQDINIVLDGFVFTADATYTTNALLTFALSDPDTGDVTDGVARPVILTDINTGNPQGGRPKISLDGSPLPANVFSSDYETTFVFGASQIRVTADDAFLEDIDDNIQKIEIVITDAVDGGSENLTVPQQVISGMAGRVKVTYDPLSKTLVLTREADGTQADLETVLRSVTYNHADNTNKTGTSRQINFTVTDATPQSTSAHTLITFDQGGPELNLDPADTSGAGDGNYKKSYTPGGPATLVVDPALITLTDPDGKLSSATLKLNTVETPDNEFLFVDVSETSIVSEYDPVTGELRLTGVDTDANYLKVLKSVRYSNVAVTPTQNPRIITITVRDEANSDTKTTTLTADGSAPPTTIIDLNVSRSSGAVYPDYHTVWNQGGETSLTHTDAMIDETDNVIQKLTITIANNTRRDGVDEVISASVVNTGITASYDQASGVLTLQGPASESEFITVLRKVKYKNNFTPKPNGESRDFRFDVYGNSDNVITATALTTISIPPGDLDAGTSFINLDPDDSSDAGGNDYRSEWDRAAWNPIADTDATVDNTAGTLREITIRITNPQNNLSSEVITADGNSQVSVSYDSSTGILSLEGTANGRAPASAFQSVLRTVRYRNNSPVVNGSSRTFLFQVHGGTNIVSANATLSLPPEELDAGDTEIDLDPDDSSGAGGNNYRGDWDQENPTRIVDTDATVTNILANNSEGTLRKITVTILDRQDDLNEVLTANENDQVSSDYDPSSGVLTLQAKDGRTSAAAFQNVLRSVRYQNTSSVINGSSREFKFEVFGGANVAEATSRIAVGVPSEKGVTKLNLDPDDSSEAGGKDYFGDWDQSTSNKVVDTDAFIENNLFVGTPAELTSLTVKVLNPEDGNNEVLTAQVSGDVTASYNAAESTLTLSGLALADEYETILRSVQYENTASHPTGTERHFRVSVYGGVNEPVSAISTLSTIPLDDIKGESEIDLNGPAAGVDYERRWNKHNWNRLASPSAFVTNTANIIQKIEVTIENPQDGLAEILNAKPAGAVTVEYDAPSHRLTLSGPATPAEFQNVVRSVRYENQLDSPTGDIRNFEFVVFGGIAEAKAKAILDVDHVGGPNDGNDEGDGDDDDDSNIPGDGGGSDGGNDAGDSDGSGGSSRSRLDLNGKGAGYNYTTTWVKGQNTNLTAGDATIIDSDGVVQRLRVSIEGGGLLGENITVSLPAGLTSSYSNGLLVIEGPGSTANFISALRSLRYTTSGVDLRGTTRRFRFELYGDVNDGDKLTSVAYTTIDTKDTGNKNNRFFTGNAVVGGNESETTIVYRIKNTTATTMHNILVTGQLLGTRLETEALTAGPDKGTASIKWMHPPSMRRSLDKKMASRTVRWVIDSLEPGEVALFTVTSPLRKHEYGDRLTTEWKAAFPGTVSDESVDSLFVR